MSSGMFSSVLVANRGEIAVRIVRTLRALGIRSVAVFSDADAGAPHVRAADSAVRLGPAAAAESYLSIERIVAAAEASGAEAVHPGYGFLAENAAFAAACTDAGIVFVGPPAAAIEVMGDKVRAKEAAARAGIPVVPGSGAVGPSDDDLRVAAERIGYPVLLKPSAGGGGKGIREVLAAGDLADAAASARREALASFGDATLLVELLIASPRHIEIQVLADRHGNVVHLGERECSLQRRHQKLVEEAPSALLTDEQRAAMGAAACEVARACGYTGAGTVEFVVDGTRPDDWFFLEMNTRLQVEHPVTEAVYGVDLVELQLRVAAGERAPWPADLRPRGHAVEARVCAEDPANGFLPTGGRVLLLREPSGPGVRVDSGLAEGGTVGSDYDPMLAKVIAHGADRDEALRRLDAALAGTVVLGLGTNVGFLRALLADGDVRAGRLDTGLVGRRLGACATDALPEHVLAAVAAHGLLALEPTGDVVDPFDVPGGWRVGEHAWTARRLAATGHDPVDVRIRGRAGTAELVLGDGPPGALSVVGPGPGELSVTFDGVTRGYACVADGPTTWIAHDGSSWAVVDEPRSAGRRHRARAAGGRVTSPMPGTVTVVEVTEGEAVTTGQKLVVVEAMKMEHVLVAPVDGTVRGLAARAGEPVAKDALLLTVEP